MTLPLKVLVACEFSGTVRRAFSALGHDAWSCDLDPATDNARNHYQCDVRDVVFDHDWDLVIAHPPCTYLSQAGARWWNKTPERIEKQNAAARFIRQLSELPVFYIAIENPRGLLTKYWRPADQYIQPYQFGHPYSKATGLWLKNLPLLQPTNLLSEWSPYLPSNTGSGRGHKGHAPRGNDAKNRSVTFEGIAQAMAAQWSDHIIKREML